MSSQANTQFCPLCGGDNRCAIADGGSIDECWCRGAQIDTATLAAIPAAERGRRCLCPGCAAPDSAAHPVKGATSER